ncbi:hypothetical protein F7D01_06305 [Erythrobacter sp. 3-20A1M]|uniref:EI24 domain-containing protein n=1 Tax=Erythrobacter sp. 3-20A1M TaxID=2653850 RepID=UPI001BFC5EBF|nr:EI24 domain-containing protein [Erythrobacter sp. 3-20A1M]QWC58319.1 hypothetical protein F7D01_06305 [Erythrobacter sp. 3-20A1M]
MLSLPASLARAVAQLGDPAILRVLGKSILATLGIFALAGAGLYALLQHVLSQWIASYDDTLAGVLTLLAVALGGWLLFRVIALAVIQFFADDVVRAVERRHYPQAAASARELPFAESLAEGAKGAGRTVLVNLLIAPVALVLLVTGVGTILLFWVVNAWLVGRELRDLAWLPHRASREDPPPVDAVTRFLLGGAIAALLAVPFLNLLAPVIGAAAATHLVHGRSR